METAKELKKIAELKRSEQISNALTDAKRHMIQRCRQEAEKGKYKYMFISKSVHQDIIVDLFYEFLKIAHEFEENGYIIKILRDYTSVYCNYLDFYILWGGNTNINHNYTDILYDTYNGICQENIKKIKEEDD